jgi:putative transposase
VLLEPRPGLTTGVCAALGVSRASVHRRRLIAPPPIQRVRSRPVHALTGAQRRVVLDLLHAPRFADQAPTEIYATLLDEGVYRCSIRSMYRLLGQHGEVRERRRQLCYPVYQKPELPAEKPNEVWSWDITKLMGPTKWSYFYLYVILDIFSRGVVGWRLADAESATLFRPLFEDAITKHNMSRGQLTLHADRGGPMKAKATAFLLADLGVTRSHSRPNTSNDNPFSESHFKTLKYQPRFPQRSGALRTPGTSAAGSSIGATGITIMPGLALRRPIRCISARGALFTRPGRSRLTARSPSTPRGLSTRRPCYRQTHRRLD